MSAFNAKGTRIRITKGSATPTNLTPTDISAAAPAVVTCTPGAAADGDIVYVSDTGMPSIDNKYWVISNVTGTEVTLVGSDTTGETFTAGGLEAVMLYAANDVLTLCLSDFTINNEEPGTIDVGTYCDPSASLPDEAGAGTIAVGGYVNENDADYVEMVAACTDGKQRVIEVVFPNDHGSLIAPVTFSSMGYDAPKSGAPAWSATGVLGSRFRHLY